MKQVEYDTIKSHKERMFPNTDYGTIRTFNLLKNGKVVETFQANEVRSMAKEAGLDVRGLSERLMLERTLPLLSSPQYRKLTN